MLRVRLKADGRLVEVLPDGGEREISPDPRAIVAAAHDAARWPRVRPRRAPRTPAMRATCAGGPG